ncbi:MAG: HlyC/CorC family transporter [Labilithrix sp.]|nr:HlyC/CorC family transporter [Labilithrix sp.]MCW5836519.1 HlyC/CorC family transporter [Labilithrix sp.]
MNGIGLQVLVIFGLTLLNAFFAGAEIAILAVRKTRLRELAEEGHRAARTALRLREEPERFLATVQIGITVVGATAGAFGGAVLEQPLATLLRRVGLGVASEKLAFALVVALISVLSVVVGELVPKSLALRYSEQVALRVSSPLFVLSRIARPIVWFLTAAANLVLRPFRDRTTFTEARLSPEELRQLVEEATAAGTVDPDTGTIASRAIDLGNLKAYSVMAPRAEIAWIPVDATESAVASLLRERPHARYPVVDGAQHPMGYVLAYELYAQLLDRRLDLRSLLRDIPAFPEGAPAVEVLRALQRARSEIGLIVDETGSASGLVSIEMLAEELFGEIAGEREKVVPAITAAGEGAYDVRGDAPLHEINRDLGLELPIEPSASTLGGLVLAVHGSFPEPGARVVLPGDVGAEVLEVSGRRVALVRLRVRAAKT